ncbi:SMI1/KNR4 family protein [Streptomyces sp. NPDC091292]|uniref:SMI1/KNR4 family protein n=1 Tax=Streptomyces sp. NPDC091292 TaxID=3365991 RepID=UPI00382E321E
MTDPTATDTDTADTCPTHATATDTAAADTTAYDWRSFLLGWSGEWADSLSEDESRGEDDEAARQARWLGFPPASEDRIAAMERRIGRRMPPSYREFLKVSDGWQHAGGFVSLLAGTDDARWHNDESGLADVFEEDLDEDSEPEERREADLWRRGLQLDVESDATYVLMDPEDVDEVGEWAVYTWAGWRAAPPERYANFLEFMRSMHREFHSLRAHRSDGEPAFVNDTTRNLDALLDEARMEALRGGWERAGRTLDEAKEYGRPGATGLGDQIRRLLGQTSMVYFDGLVTDPRYAPELLPPLVAEHAAHSYRDDSTLKFSLRGADDDLVSLAYATLDQVRDGTYRYTAAGPFGEAVERARELARWGETDGAWRTLMDALPRWEPLGPDHLAPLGWVADPLLGSLLTPERGRELLATPRGGHAGEAPAPTAALDPGNLAWLADPDPGGNRTSYRFVLVEGVEPEELARRLADGDGDADGGGGGPVLNRPATRWEAARHGSRRDRGEFSSYDDKALMAVGRAGAGWSFAFDGEPAPFDRQRFVSPAGAVGGGTRAVVVWGGLRSWRGDAFFHLSVARDGVEDVEEYAFTYADGEIRRSGDIPRALEPSRFLGEPEDAAEAERPLLEAVAAEFGVRLPRHALVNGRLHTFTSRSWTRPPRDGETYTVIRMGWGAGAGAAHAADGERPGDEGPRST